MTAELFRQLGAFSAEVLKGWKLPTESPWGRDIWSQKPRGAVIHSTIGKSLEKVARWFCDTRFGSKACSHVIVAQTKLPELDALESRYPLLGALPVTVLQVRPPGKPASHASWVNDRCYGLELINAGVLSPQGGEWYDKRGELVRPADGAPVFMHGRYWERYPAAQVMATITLLRAYDDVSPRGLAVPWVIGHEQVQGTETAGSSHRDKRDPGPLFPLADVRGATFSSGLVSTLDWWQLFTADERYGQTWRDGYALRYCDAVYGRNDERTAKQAWQQLLDDTKHSLDVSNMLEQPEPLDAMLLCALGYFADEGARWTEPLSQFRRMAGLRSKARFDAEVRRELARRVFDRGFALEGPDHLI